MEQTTLLYTRVPYIVSELKKRPVYPGRGEGGGAGGDLFFPLPLVEDCCVFVCCGVGGGGVFNCLANLRKFAQASPPSSLPSVFAISRRTCKKATTKKNNKIKPKK